MCLYIPIQWPDVVGSFIEIVDVKTADQDTGVAVIPNCEYFRSPGHLQAANKQESDLGDD